MGSTGGGIFLTAGGVFFLSTLPFVRDVFASPLTLTLSSFGGFLIEPALFKAPSTSGFAVTGFALNEDVRFTEGSFGTVSTGFLGLTLGGGALSVDASLGLCIGEGVLSILFLGTVVDTVPSFLAGDGVRDFRDTASPMCNNQALVGARKPPFTLGSVICGGGLSYFGASGGV